MTVLVVGTDNWAIEQARTSLAKKGARVLRCHEPNAPAFPCNALIEGRRCPLDVGFDVAVTVRARPAPVPTLGETGVTCALHAGVPLVVAGVHEGDPFQPWATQVVDYMGDVATACATVVAAKKDYIDLTDRERQAADNR